MTTINKNKKPYYDDFDGQKGYHEVLFLPSRAVQVRELNQIQSMFYSQIERFGNHVFKEGSLVIPGGSSYNTNYDYVKVTINDFSNVSPLIVEGQTRLVGQTSGVKAVISQYFKPTDTDPSTFYIQYTNSGTDNQSRSFASELLNIVDANDNVIGIASADETGVGSKFAIVDGVYYIGGRFVAVSAQTIPIEKYSDTPSARVGLTYNEKVVTQNDDQSLFDNAQGSPNFTAPGAHRLAVDVTLESYGLQEVVPDDFVELFRIDNGVVKKYVDNSVYSVLGDTLARRTYNESGNYEVDGFDIDIKEHLKENNNGGVYTAAQGGDESKFVASISKGLAYVKGYEVETLYTKNVAINKARDVDTVQNNAVTVTLGYYISVDSIDGLPDLSTYEVVDLQDGGAASIGSARVKSIAYNGTGYDVYLFDIKDTNGDVSTTFISNLRSIVGTNFTAPVSVANAVIKGTENPGLVYKTNYQFVKTLVNPDTGTTDTSLTVLRQYNTTVGTDGTVVLTADADQTFVAQNSQLGIASYTDATGGIVDTSGIYTLGGTPTGSSITFDFGGTEADRPVTINVIVSIDNAVEKIKAPTDGSITGSTTSGILSLEKADVMEITSITDNTGADVTSLFSLRKNINRSYYGISYVEISDESLITNPVTVNFRYFSHGQGQFFTVDSYSSIDYSNIPIEGTQRLADVIDFRPRMADDGSGFVGTGANTTVLPIPQALLRCDLQFYLPRKDVIYITENGELGVAEGESSTNPEYPDNPSNSMELYNLYIPPYTTYLDAVRASEVSIARYTMDDIGQLEDRIENLEYYISLNLLEKDAADIQIVDPDTGLNRFKNGFLVDSFVDHSIGDNGWTDYHCALGDEELRPEMRYNGIDFDYDALASSGIVVNNGIATLDYNEETYLEQDKRSTYINVNPYAVFRWEGDITLNPSVDNWVDVVYTSPQVITRTVTRERTVTNPDQEWRNDSTVLSSSTSKKQYKVEPNSKFENPVATDLGLDQNQDLVKFIGDTWGAEAAANPAKYIATETVETTSTQLLQRITNHTSSSGRTRILNNEWLPYMRSREVRVTGEGHKPETKLNFFFDDIDINSYVKPDDQSSYGDPVQTDAEGNFSCVFKVPNDSNLKFPVGTKLFVATDYDENRKELALSYGSTEYTATSRRETRQRTVIRTQVRTIERATVTETSSETVHWADPLAQSFLVEENGGVFVTGIDLFFFSKDDNAPVHVDIREMENGIPTQRIIPGSKTMLTPGNVNTSEDGSVASTFVFKHPVYLEEKHEYCFFIRTNSIAYNVFVAKMGEKDMGTGKYIAKQPYLGVMFKSQNSSTWTEDQNTDIQFRLKRAVFDKVSNGTLVLNNADRPTIAPGVSILSSTNGSNVVNINANKHNFIAGSTITISGAVAGNGFADTDINGSHTVTNVVDMHNVEIEISGVNATATGSFGGTDVAYKDQAIASFFNLDCNDVRYTDTSIRYEATGTTGQSYDGTEVAYQPITSPIILEKGGMQSLKNPWLITNKEDETANLSGSSSMTINASLATSNKNVSPVIDLYAFNLIAPYYMIDGKLDTVEPSGSNAYAKYRTKIAPLAENSVSIRAFVDTIFDQDSEVIMSCRVGNSEEEVIGASWLQMNPVSTVSNTGEKMMEMEYYLDGSDGLPEHTYFQVMIQMKSKSQTRVPICRRLRIISLGT